MRTDELRNASGYTDTVDAIVVAMCLDYERRRHEIEKDTLSHRTLMEYRYLNYRVFDGAAEIVGIDDADIYIYEIGRKIGYAKSTLDDVSEFTYKRKKMEVKVSIARSLHLL